MADNRYNFSSPGAEATDALVEFLAREDAKRRQAMLDELTKQRAAREDQMALENLALNQRRVAVEEEQARTLAMQREAAAEEMRRKRAAGIISNLSPDQTIDDETATTLREGGMGVFVRRGQPGIAVVSPNAPMTGDEGVLPSRRAVDVTPGETTFTGTRQQQAMTRLMSSDAIPQSVKDMIEAGVVDDTALARMLEPDKSGRLFRVGRNGQLMVQDETTGQFRATTADDKPYSKDRDQFVTEPAPQTGGVMNDARKVATFNSIASSYERSPLIRAADRTLVLNEASREMLDPKTGAAALSDPSKQLNLAYAYIQALDTYQSAVREGELQNLGTLGTKLQQLATEANRVATTGAFMHPDVAKQIATTAQQLVGYINKGRTQKQKEYASRARVSGVGDMWNDFTAGFAVEDTAPSTSSSAPNANTSSATPVVYTRDAQGRLIRK